MSLVYCTLCADVSVSSGCIIRSSVSLHHFQVFQEIQKVHEVPLVPVLKTITDQLKASGISLFQNSVYTNAYLQLHQALQPHQGRLGNPVAPKVQMTK